VKKARGEARPQSEAISGTLSHSRVCDALCGSPDGQTIYLAAANLAWSVSLFENLAYDPLIDFSAVGLVARTPSILAVNPALPAKSVKDLIALAKASPGKINSAGGTGTSMQTDMELFKAMADVDLPRHGIRRACNLERRSLGHHRPDHRAAPHMRSGALRALAISSEQRSAALAELPTVAETGVPGFETSQWYGILVPSRTPRDIVVRLNREIGDVIRAPNVETLLASQALMPATDTPDVERFVRAQVTKWAKLLKPAEAPPL
jgi:tripartite-type tricarboxylate transporter receptor subunit TctC